MDQGGRLRLGGQGRCESRSEVIVKIQKKKFFFFFFFFWGGGGLDRGLDRGSGWGGVQGGRERKIVFFF